MRPVNLIPEDQRTGGAPTGRSGIAGYIIIGALLVAIGVLAYVTLLGNKIDEHKSDIAALEVRAQESEARAAALAPYVELAGVRQARSATIDSLAKSRFNWVRVLRELARVTPPSISLSNLTGTVSPAVGVDGGVEIALRSQVPGPALEIAGCVTSQRRLADYIAALRDIDGVTRVAAQNSNKPELEDEQTQAATADQAAPAGTEADVTGECARPKDANFQIVAAFDAMPVPPSATDAGAVTVSTTGADDGGVAAEQQSQAQQQQQISNASQQSQDAVNLVPGG